MHQKTFQKAQFERGHSKPGQIHLLAWPCSGLRPLAPSSFKLAHLTGGPRSLWGQSKGRKVQSKKAPLWGWTFSWEQFPWEFCHSSHLYAYAWSEWTRSAPWLKWLSTSGWLLPALKLSTVSILFSPPTSASRNFTSFLSMFRLEKHTTSIRQVLTNGW